MTGWATCDRGHQHWGRFGAAGLLMIDRGQVLLQHRSRMVHNGGTWSIPGGAIERGETATEAALRETSEELGAYPDLDFIGEHVNDHGGWTYTTVLVRPSDDVRPTRGPEGHHEWVRIKTVETLHLHRGFGESWPTVRAMVAGSSAS